ERAGGPADPLFPTRTGRRLSRDAVELRVTTHAGAAAEQCPSLVGKKVHPHVLRHSCAMSLLHAGVDTSVIALWLGHAGVRSTDAYVHADLNIKEGSVALFDLRRPKVVRRRCRALDAGGEFGECDSDSVVYRQVDGK